MKKGLFVLLGVLAAGAASAITMNWEWTSNGNDWQKSSSIYMVYSQSALSADQAVAATNQNYGSNPASGATNSVGQAWSAPETVEGTRVSDPSVSSFPPMGNSGNVGFSSSNFDFSGLSSGYFYLVIFNNTTASNATSFAVAQAGETGYVADLGNATPGPGTSVDPILFIDPTWIGGMYRSPAPEPTALALLALGVAGVALRRRVR